jgi:ribulose bisphosphate carboxylase small subunit
MLSDETKIALRIVALDPNATLNERDAAHTILHKPVGAYTGEWRAASQVLRGYMARQQGQDRYGK